MSVSFDSVETSKRVKETLKLSFPLLSDEGSKTIDAYGIRNKGAAGSRIDGVPHPMTLIIGKDGVVKAKLAHDGHGKRHGGAEILAALKEAMGEK